MELRLDTSPRQIWGMALPIALSLLVPQINFITNTVFLSGLGERALASAGITGVYYLIFAVIGSGLNNGLQALIARRAGQNQPSEIGRLFYHGAWLALGIAVLGILLTYAVAPAVLRASISNELIAREVIDFLFIRIWGLPLLYLYVIRNALLVGTNQSQFLIWGTLAEALVNVVLDYALIYGKLGFPAIGFNGAAYASIVAEASGLIVIYAIIHRKGIHKRFSFFSEMRWDKKLFNLIFTQSAPLIAQYSISITSWEFFYILIEHHGERALAVSNTMRNVIGLFGIFSWAFAATTNTMVSNIIGQGRKDEVVPLIKRIAFFSFCISFSLFVMLNLFPEWFLGVYNRDEAFIDYAIPVVRVVAIALVTMSIGTVWLNAVTGTGNTRVNLLIECINLAVYCVYVYLVLEYWQMPITWGWASEVLYWVGMFALAYLYIRSGRWKSKVL